MTYGQCVCFENYTGDDCSIVKYECHSSCRACFGEMYYN